MPSQTAHLHQMMQNCRQKARVLAVTSGKGGVGKTNISANLGICLAASNKKVLLVDADFSLGNLDVLLNINSKYNISHLLSGKRTIEEVIHTGPEGVEIICGASGLEQLANIGEFQRQRLLTELSSLQNDTDVMIIDTAAGISKSVISFCLSADEVLVVTTTEAAAITDAYAMIKVLVGNKYDGRINVLVNMAESQAAGKKTYHQIATVAKRFLGAQVYHAGVLVRDDQMLSAIAQREPVVLAYPKAKVTSELAALANKLSNTYSANHNKEGFFKKFVEWFF